jgi:hypothetical protein
MQRVSECESVVFYGPAASPQGWPPAKTSLPFRRFLIANGITNAYKKDGRDAEHIPPILMPSGDTYLSSR